MTAAPTPDWNVFKQIFANHWDEFKRVYPRYDQRYYDGLVHKMLACGNPAKMGYIEYRCLQCGQGTCNDLITSDALLDYITGFSLN